MIVFSQAPKDTIYFLNGTTVIGKIKKIKLGVVTFDPDEANDITVQMIKLRTLAAVRQVFRIETIQGKVYFGQLRPHPNPNYVYFVGGTDSVTIHVQEISVVYPFKNEILQRFSGNFGLGFNYTKSSDFGRLNFDAKLNYYAKQEVITLSTSGIYTITDTTFSRDREDVSLKWNHYFTTTWFSTIQTQYQRNLELGLDRRFQEGVGAGNKFITSRKVYAWTRGGVVFNQERSTENVNSGTLTELFAQLEFNFFRYTKPKVDFTIAQAMFFSLSQAGRIRNDGEANLNWEIIKDLRLNLSFYNNYDSKPPNVGGTKFDFGWVFGLSFVF